MEGVVFTCEDEHGKDQLDVDKIGDMVKISFSENNQQPTAEYILVRDDAQLLYVFLKKFLNNRQ